MESREKTPPKAPIKGSVANFNFSDKISKIFSNLQHQINFRQSSSVKLDHYAVAERAQCLVLYSHLVVMIYTLNLKKS